VGACQNRTLLRCGVNAPQGRSGGSARRAASCRISNRDSIWRTLKAESLNRRTKPTTDKSAKGQVIFRDDDLGFVHVDIKHLPKLHFSRASSEIAVVTFGWHGPESPAGAADDCTD
jgi:hypothetical protein